MNYIYDILVNYKYPLLDFYEWNKNDNIINIKKIPVFKVKKSDLHKLCSYQFKLINFIDIIKNKTNVYGKNNIKYACIMSDNEEAVSFLFNKEGNCIGKSRMLLDEELEVLELVNRLVTFDIKYIIKRKDRVELYKTVTEVKKRKYIIKQLNQITDIDKLNYIYFECFNRVDDNPKSRLLSQIDSSWDEIGYKLYDFFNIK